MGKWEYDLFGFSSMDGQSLRAKMNEMGQQGWEFCGQSAFPQPDGLLFCYLFKRPEKLVVAVDHLVTL